MSQFSRRNFIRGLSGSVAATALTLVKPVVADDTQKVIEGEEWRDMDTGAVGYTAAGSDAIIAQAKSHIEKIRKRDVSLIVVDKKGKPLKNTLVEVSQQKQAFPFGDQLWQLDRLFRFNQQNTDKAFYWRLRFKELFNAANALCYWTERPRNDGPKTEDIQGRQNLEGFAYCVDWAAAQGLYVKGHPLFWSIPKCVPDWVKRYDYETQLKYAETRVRNIVARFRGKVQYYDAVNEALWEATFKNLSNRNWPHIEPIDDIADMVAQVLEWARHEDPDVNYTINDYGLAQDPTGKKRLDKNGTHISAAFQRKRYIQLVKALVKRGASPDAIGLQCHIGGWQNPADQVAFYDEMETAGLPLHVTEFWASTKELENSGKYSKEEIEAMQVEFIENYLTIAFGHPAIDAFYFWGFMNASIHWGEYSSHRLKPLYLRIQKLLREDWMTHETLKTDHEGKVRFKGFYGDYALRYTLKSGQKTGVRFSVTQADRMPLRLMASLA